MQIWVKQLRFQKFYNNRPPLFYSILFECFSCNIPSRRVSLPTKYNKQRLDLLDTPCLSEGDLSLASSSMRYRLSPPTFIIRSFYQTSSDSLEQPDTPSRSRITVSTMVNDNATPSIVSGVTPIPFDILVRSSIPEWL